ncbi:hypothetical protein RIF29_19169 [Crotalaria pallida]|uniref:Uncharacterized protein n=1 Tax=Crotalaria pallida TaxID=3830 RepID=A0AAN9F7C4_CROPI
MGTINEAKHPLLQSKPLPQEQQLASFAKRVNMRRRFSWLKKWKLVLLSSLSLSLCSAHISLGFFLSQPDSSGNAPKMSISTLKSFSELRSLCTLSNQGCIYDISLLAHIKGVLTLIQYAVSRARN